MAFMEQEMVLVVLVVIGGLATAYKSYSQRGALEARVLELSESVRRLRRERVRLRVGDAVRVKYNLDVDEDGQTPSIIGLDIDE